MTPLLRQYFDIKQRYPEEIVLFQVGDFYEIFDTDAQRVAPALGIVLTQRGTIDGRPLPLCGFPCHTVDSYLMKLVQSGFRVVICDQVTTNDPEGKKAPMIDRVVSSVITPATVTNAQLLDEKAASYLAILVPEETSTGLLFFEFLTGRACATVLTGTDRSRIDAELARFLPQEIIIPVHERGRSLERYLKTQGYSTTLMTETMDSDATGIAWLRRSIMSEAVTLVERSLVLRQAIALLYQLLIKNHPRAIEQFSELQIYYPQQFLQLDAGTQRHLELVANLQDGSRANTLFETLDRAVTGMGSRLIRSWLLRPLVDVQTITRRLTWVEQLVTHAGMVQQLIGGLTAIGDLERTVGRVALGRGQLRDYLRLASALQTVPAVLTFVAQSSLSQLVARAIVDRDTYVTLGAQLVAALSDDPEKGWLIRAGYNGELDRLRHLISDASQAILALEQREQLATGIGSLKIKFNGAHGYGIEVTKPHLHLVPPTYRRIQTLVNRERFTSDELLALESDIRRAEVAATELEKELFAAVCQTVAGAVGSLKVVSSELAELDALLGFARAAREQGYVRPKLVEGQSLVVLQGRHPVVERRMVQQGQAQFIANDVALTEDERLWIITGPNMGGKSTFLRQTALMIIMAQAGSFVPAAEAQVPIFDKIFTRIGASDDVAKGKSTFLVEMEETALICKEATSRSLVILDEVGRGTSTYDGLAIAQAVLEHIHQVVKARCLFATHYHELTELASTTPGIAAYHAASERTEQGIVLLHQIKRGCAEGSFGIAVAQSAALPSSVISRAQQILARFSPPAGRDSSLHPK